MHFGIDGNEANIKNRVGVGQFALEVLKHLEKIDQKNSYTVYLSSPPLPDLPKPRPAWKYRVFGPTKFWTQWRLPLDLFLGQGRPDLFLSLTHYSPRFSPIPTVCSIMDLQYIHFPDSLAKKDAWQLSSWTAYSLKKAAHVITISHFTKKEIVDHYRLSPSKITVAHLAAPTPPKNLSLSPKFLQKYHLSSPYFLYLGTLKPNKNISFLISAYHQFLKNQETKQKSKQKTKTKLPTLVIAGKKGWLYQDIFQAVQKLGLTKNVIFTGYIPDEDRWPLYQGALAFCIPSLYEGFGIPALEAMAVNCPVIAASSSSLPEVVGKAALLIDPKNQKSLTQALSKIFTDQAQDQALRKTLIKAGQIQTKKFSWGKTAKTILSSLEQTAQKS